jgi:hypothetical protein
MRTVPALAITLLTPITLVAMEADSVWPDRVDTPISTEQPSVGAPARELSPTAERPTQVQVSARPSVTADGANADQQADLDEALARFRDHGLELPDLDVRFFDDKADCDGYSGLFESSFTPWRLSICSDFTYVPTHELAHAWEASNLDDGARARYVEARRLTNWNDPAADWADRGMEDAARMMQQNLMATNPQLTLPAWAERLDAYELLVGRPSPLRSEPDDVADSESDVNVDEPIADAAATRDVIAETPLTATEREVVE